MDVLTDVLTVLRGGRPRTVLLGWDAPWAQEFAAVPGAIGDEFAFATAFRRATGDSPGRYRRAVT
ncbi:hypothetical protein AB0J80_09055 [Actinoplanes sp. NPDC049548]|uniref:hypothetical protein n=1 Tax=Actinoplanes sp. NPDC049548 TaxID=3155152 RepID=UPI00343CF861